MKRMAIKLLQTMILLTMVMSSVTANANPPREEPYKKVYATSEQILFDMLRPSISQYVNEHYGTAVLWFEPHIVDAKLEMRHEVSSYVVSMFVKVDDPADRTLELATDKLTMSIDSNLYRSSDYTAKSEIHLLEYRRIVPSKEQSVGSE
ncbi:hypothetical protein DFQ01_10628 [Paenibacillus cellulosilyticus]|uniref:DUF3888 domain-containing protein n=1 Tax=Paenibacillus cellulosilyticus TaxID=375489 RepID=A0A2V2YUU6_9BACL|nr:hypothetical protein [Paenibacillus cellulosilyticus]PWW04747.1 hypothetical protein DFQ01_10628 [Paenibacillus cellulosilyticus]QKS45872.1 hypothetical protein HUB94_16545 [Paenibacillus cellulosilyticus]